MALRAGRYEISGLIASGGMAKVHLGHAVGVGGFERRVAIKTMHAHLAEQADFVAMFLDEARVSARIHHPNVVATLDVQQDAEGIFLVMEYVDGFALHTILAASRDEGRTLPLGLTLRIFLDVLAGLHAAHELTDASGAPLEVVHRDVSPHNVLVGADGAARLTDFGIARAATRLAMTHEGHLKGKLRYMAPEQLGGRTVDRRADVYAAGAVLWEMLAGVGLVRGEDEGACLLEIGRADKESPRAHEPEVPEPIAAACLRALRLDPEERYPTAAAFAEALEIAATEAGVAVASPREVSALVRALEARARSTAGPASNAGAQTATGAGFGPHPVPTPTAGVEVPRAAPRSRSLAPVAVVASLAVGVAVLATAMLMRPRASAPAGDSTAPVAALSTAPAAPTASSVAAAPLAAAPLAPPPSSPPSKLRPPPSKTGGRFRPREL